MKESRVDIEWAIKGKVSNWKSRVALAPRIINRNSNIYRLIEETGYRRSRFTQDVHFGKQDLTALGFEDVFAVRAHGGLWVFPNSAIGKFLIELATVPDTEVSQYVFSYLLERIPGMVGPEVAAAVITNGFKHILQNSGEDHLPYEKEFFEAVGKTSLTTFDPFARSNRFSEDEY